MNRRTFIERAGLATSALVWPARPVSAKQISPARQNVDLSPASWPTALRDHYLNLEGQFNAPHPQAIGSRGMVAGTSNPFAVHAGLEALQHGGTAADAALCTALTQVALMFGAATSYAGVMNALYFEAATGKVHAMDACYTTVRGEIDPMTIPPLGTPSGRAVLTPGFMAGVEAMSRRFGTIPFANLFEPAIWIAEQGATANAFLTKTFASQKKLVTRLDAGRDIFIKPDGTDYVDGETFRQPTLAGTLRTIAQEGADYMYRGDWARLFVDAVQREGGKLTLDDLAAYQVTWSDPLETSFRDVRLATLGTPNVGGLTTLIAMNLLAVADLKQLGHYTKSAEALYWSIQISRLATLLANRPPESLADYFPSVPLSREALMDPEVGKRIWLCMRQPGWNETMASLRLGKPAPSHSAGVLAVDSQGNMAAAVHSINSIGWGSTGIFIGGISVPDSACIQQGTVARVGPGKPLPGPANPVIALRDDRPVLGSSAIGSGLHPVTIQNLSNVLDYGMAPKASADTPNFMGPYFGIQLTGPAVPEMEKETLGEGDFSPGIIAEVEALGQKLKVVPKAQNRPQLGYWIGIQVDPQSKALTGGVTPDLTAHVEGI
jgi:gamma-glutamyltranspeptidase / glutathione hydrolase